MSESFQLHFRSLALSNVLNCSHIPKQGIGVRVQGYGLCSHPTDLSAWTEETELAGKLAALLHTRLPFREDCLSIVRSSGSHPAIAETLFLGHSRNLLPAWVGVHADPVPISLEDAHGRRGGQRAEAGFALP